MNAHRPRRLLLAIAAMLCACALAGCSVVDAIVNGLPEDATPTPASASGVPVQVTVTPRPSQEAPTAMPVTGSGALQLVPFPQMVYTRPDVGAVAAELGNIAATMGAVEDEETAMDLMDRADAIFDTYDTALSLARIHNSIDTADPYWQAEYQLCSGGMPSIQAAYSDVLGALQDSPVGQAAGLEPVDSVYGSQEAVNLMATESELVSQYYSLRGTLTASWNGQEYTYAQALDAEEDGPYLAWYEQNARALGDVYVSLLKVRRQIAAAAGYGNYLEYLAEMDGFDPEAATRTLDEISQSLTPLYDAVFEQGVYSIEEEFTDEVVLRDLSDWVGGLDPSMLSAVDLMRAYLLYDLAPGANKESGAYTSYIPDYGAPFLFATVDGTFDSMADVMHEFGHFYCYTKDPASDSLPLDTTEVPSMALPLLLSSQFDTTYGLQTSGAMLYNELADALATFPEQGYYAAFEMAAYQLPEEQATYENLCALAQQQWDRFGLGESALAPFDWTTTIHLVESPMYTFYYIPATDVALQMWEQSTEDLPGAMRSYQQFVDMAPATEDLVGTAEYCGLRSPYAEGEMRTQAEWLSRYLLDGEAMPNGLAGEAVPEPTAQTQEGSMTATPAPTVSQEPTPAADVPQLTQAPQPGQPGGLPGETVISPPDEDRYGDFFGVTDGTTTLWARDGMRKAA